MPRRVHLTGQPFGDLTVIGPGEPYISPSGNRQSTWICLCACGRTTSPTVSNLTGGKTQSCGCRIAPAASRAFLQILTGGRYGRWTAGERGPDGPRRERRWHCVCDCGKSRLVHGTSLTHGLSTSCGCASRGPRRTAWIGGEMSCDEAMNLAIRQIETAVTDDCIAWRGPLDSDGYGRSGLIQGSRKAYVLTFMLFRKRIPVGYHVDHLCRRRECVNPYHLEAVPNGENARRMQAAKKWSKQHASMPLIGEESLAFFRPGGDYHHPSMMSQNGGTSGTT